LITKTQSEESNQHIALGSCLFRHGDVFPCSVVLVHLEKRAHHSTSISLAYSHNLFASIWYSILYQTISI